MFISMIVALALAGAVQTNAYQMDVTVVENGHETLTSRTQIMVDGPSHVRIGGVEMYTQLSTVQGDGDGATLQLESEITKNDGEPVVEPNFTFVSGQPFYFQSGEPTGKMVRLTLTPLSGE